MAIRYECSDCGREIIGSAYRVTCPECGGVLENPRRRNPAD